MFKCSWRLGEAIIGSWEVANIAVWSANVPDVASPNAERVYEPACPWMPQANTTHTEQRITLNIINHCIRFACNSADTEELPDDDTHGSKHEAAAE
jgi:hypothetical protein